MLFMSCVCHTFASVHCYLVVTSRNRADLLALICGVYCDVITFPFDILVKVWYLNVSIPDPCCLSYFNISLHGHTRDPGLSYQRLSLC